MYYMKKEKGCIKIVTDEEGHKDAICYMAKTGYNAEIVYVDDFMAGKFFIEADSATEEQVMLKEFYDIYWDVVRKGMR